MEGIAAAILAMGLPPEGDSIASDPGFDTRHARLLFAILNVIEKKHLDSPVGGAFFFIIIGFFQDLLIVFP